MKCAARWYIYESTLELKARGGKRATFKKRKCTTCTITSSPTRTRREGMGRSLLAIVASVARRRIQKGPGHCPGLARLGYGSDGGRTRMWHHGTPAWFRTTGAPSTTGSGPAGSASSGHPRRAWRMAFFLPGPNRLAQVTFPFVSARVPLHLCQHG